LQLHNDNKVEGATQCATSSLGQNDYSLKLRQQAMAQRRK